MDYMSCFDQATRWVGGLFEDVTPTQLNTPTPCADWDVRGVMNHVVFVNLMLARAARGEPLPSDHSSMPDVLGDDPAAAYRASAEGILSAFSDQEALERTVTAPCGELPGIVFVGHAFTHNLVHGWDLAKAIGHDTRLDPLLVHAAQQLWQELLTDEIRPPQSFDSKKTVPDTASEQDKLMAFLGRQP